MNNYSNINPTILIVFPKLLHILSHTAHTQILEAVHVPCMSHAMVRRNLGGEYVVHEDRDSTEWHRGIGMALGIFRPAE